MFARKSAGHEPGSPKFEKYFFVGFCDFEKNVLTFSSSRFCCNKLFLVPFFLYLPVTWEKICRVFFLKLGQNFFVLNDGVTDAVTQKSEKASTSSSTSSLV